MLNAKQFKNSFFRCCPVVISLMLTVGCASMQKVRVVSEPPDAVIKVENEHLSNTPSTIELSKKKSHTIVVQKKGYEKKEITIKKRLSPSKIAKSFGYAALLGASMFLKSGLDGKITNGEFAATTIGLGVALPILFFGQIGTGNFNVLTPDSVAISLSPIEQPLTNQGITNKGEMEARSESPEIDGDLKGDAVTEIDKSTETDDADTVKTNESTDQNSTSGIIDNRK